MTPNCVDPSLEWGRLEAKNLVLQLMLTITATTRTTTTTRTTMVMMATPIISTPMITARMIPCLVVTKKCDDLVECDRWSAVCR